ncbi:DUF805 domain-containing protein, partial [Salmonella enterica subsp. enterica serovar Muenster]|nr:DUF805 domain-containing protein [Salmonella enterica subsp. enterica serovar Muenster]
MDWYLKVLKNYLGFGGRARRKEYWMFILVNIIFTFVLGLLVGYLVVLMYVQGEYLFAIMTLILSSAGLYIFANRKTYA